MKFFLSDKGSLSDKYRKVLTDNQIEFEEGGHSLDKIYNAGLVIKSPGIPDDNPVVKELRRRGVEVISEIEFAGRHSSAKNVLHYRQQRQNHDNAAD